MKIYLDNCCYNRPYDDQTQMRINLETQAKIHIQEMIRDGKLELMTSYVLEYENSKNRYLQKHQTIAKFMEENESYYVGEKYIEDVEKIAATISATGVKEKDAAHVACAMLARCDYLFLQMTDY